MIDKRASLLCAGIKKISGDFEDGDVVEVLDENNNVIARGLVNFDSEELPRMMGKNSQKLLEEFGEGYDREVLHRDNLVILNEILDTK